MKLYSVYLPEPIRDRLIMEGRNRNASEIVRNALDAYFSKEDLYAKGYTTALRQALQIIDKHNSNLVVGEIKNLLHALTNADAEPATP